MYYYVIYCISSTCICRCSTLYPILYTDCGTLISVPDDLGNLWAIVVVQAVDVVHDTCPVHEFLELGVSKNGGSLKWMVYNGKSY